MLQLYIYEQGKKGFKMQLQTYCIYNKLLNKLLSGIVSRKDFICLSTSQDVFKVLKTASFSLINS